MKIKMFVISSLMMGISCIGFSQDFSNCGDIILKEKVDYPKTEGKVLECARYILTTPEDKNNLNRLYAMQFLLRWMEGTPDYQFKIDESAGRISKANEELMGVYLACMTKFMLENKDKSKDDAEVKYNSFLLLIGYTEDPNNQVSVKGEMKKMIKAKNEGKLKEFLKM
jgi:hypothetical protein